MSRFARIPPLPEKLLILNIPRILTALAALTLSSASGDHILNGVMEDVPLTSGGNHLVFESLDQGWVSKSASNFNFATNPGVVTWNGPNTNVLGNSFAQVNTVSDESGSSLTFSFNWTPMEGSTSPYLEFNVVAWKRIDMLEIATTDQLFKFINGGASGVSGLTDGTNGTAQADVFDLLAASENNRGGVNNYQVTDGIASGTLGSTLNFSTTIDLSDDGGGITEVSGYDYIGVRFKLAGDIPADDITSQGSALDNVVLTTGGDPGGNSGPQITAIEVDEEGEVVKLTWTSVPGATYGIDRATVLNGLWLEREEEFTVPVDAVGTASAWDDANALTLDETRFFYRIRLVSSPQ